MLLALPKHTHSPHGPWKPDSAQGYVLASYEPSREEQRLPFVALFIRWKTFFFVVLRKPGFLLNPSDTPEGFIRLRVDLQHATVILQRLRIPVGSIMGVSPEKV